MVSDDIDDDDRVEIGARTREYWGARRLTNASLLVLAMAGLLAFLLEPRPLLRDAGPDPTTTVDTLAAIVACAAAVAAYVFHGKMAEAAGWLRGRLGTEPPRPASPGR